MGTSLFRAAFDGRFAIFKNISKHLTKLGTTSNQCRLYKHAARTGTTCRKSAIFSQPTQGISSNPMNPKRHFEETLEMFAEYTAAASHTAHASQTGSR